MDNALKFEKVPELPHDNYNKISTDLVTLLNDRSAQSARPTPSSRSRPSGSSSTSSARPGTRSR